MKYKVTILRTISHTTEIEVEAESEEKALELVESASIEQLENDLLAKANWDLDDETYSVEDVEEIE
jgi:hypothetical protein